MLTKFPFLSRSIILSGLIILSACSSENPQGAQGFPPQPIDVAEVISADVIDWSLFTTRLEAPEQVELRPRVNGVVDSVEFNEGAVVTKGDLLIRLDPRPFRAEVNRLTAQKQAAIAALKQAELEDSRTSSLRNKKAISTEQAEARSFLAEQRRAEVASVDAALQSARLNLEYTRIKAPISGKTSRAFVTAGNTVAAGQTVLTSLVSTDEVYAYFDIDERTWNQKFSDTTADSGLVVYLQLSGEEGFTHQGVLDFIDNQVDIHSGTLRVRAAFPVDSQRLRPGSFGRVRIAPVQAEASILVPERSIGTDLENRFVLVVDENNTLQYRVVTLGSRVGALRVIKSGLKAGDRIAVNGPARVGPGMPIEPREAEIDRQDLSTVLPATRLPETVETKSAIAAGE